MLFLYGMYICKDLKSLKARRQDVKNGAAVSQDVDDSESKARIKSWHTRKNDLKLKRTKKSYF